MMKNILAFYRTSVLISIYFTCVLGFTQSTATYNITLESLWDTNHSNLPAGAHWSKLVGANHNNNITFLEMSQIATFGIERIAEEGVNVEFRDNEVQPSIVAGYTEQYIDGNGLGSAAGTITIMGLEICEDYPLLTLVSMIAPSPDWMIAINSYSLLDAGNNWKDNITIDLFPYDAGTDSGTNYNSANDNTIPQDPISSLQNLFPFSNEKIGTLTVTLESVLDVNENILSEVKIFPNPTEGNITISNMGNKNIKSIQVFSSQGKLLNNLPLEETNVANMNLETLQSGFYFLKITTNDGFIKTKKLIVK